VCHHVIQQVDVKVDAHSRGPHGEGYHRLADYVLSQATHRSGTGGVLGGTTSNVGNLAVLDNVLVAVGVSHLWRK
jgi:hypothetical protein